MADDPVSDIVAELKREKAEAAARHDQEAEKSRRKLELLAAWKGVYGIGGTHQS